GAGVDGYALVDVGDRGGDHLLFLALVKGVELTVGAEHEDAVDAGRDLLVDEGAQARQVEVLVGLHRRDDRGNDAVDLHDATTFLSVHFINVFATVRGIADQGLLLRIDDEVQMLQGQLSDEYGHAVGHFHHVHRAGPAL